MTIETFLAILGGIGTVVCWVGYNHAKENVYMTYKEQRIPQNNKKEIRK